MMKKSPRYPISGLYAITPEEHDTAALLNKVRQALQGGVQVLQYRNKLGNASLRQTQATALLELTREFAVPLIINDDAALAKQVDADGVHLGGEDGSVAAARALLGDEKIIGLSCYNQIELAHRAVTQPVDYIAFGAFFNSTVKPGAPVATLDLLRQARREITLPLVAIGGITLENGASVLTAGADALAIISALFNAKDITRTARQFANLNLHI
jgi:thiamine-phosphate pyrophosphorylase